MTPHKADGAQAAYLRISDAMALLSVSRDTFRKLRMKAGFPAPRYIGVHPVFKREELLAWVDTQTEPAAA